MHQFVFVFECVCVCVYAWVPPQAQRSGWLCTESCARRLPAAASHRHSATLISWPVTVDTHSCAALREQAERRPRLQGAGKTQTLMNTSKSCCRRLPDKGRHLMLLPERSSCSLTCSLWLHRATFFFFYSSEMYAEVQWHLWQSKTFVLNVIIAQSTITTKW